MIIAAGFHGVAGDQKISKMCLDAVAVGTSYSQYLTVACWRAGPPLISIL
jgi:hypothetical protein